MDRFHFLAFLILAFSSTADNVTRETSLLFGREMIKRLNPVSQETTDEIGQRRRTSTEGWSPGPVRASFFRQLAFVFGARAILAWVYFDTPARAQPVSRTGNWKQFSNRFHIDRFCTLTKHEPTERNSFVALRSQKFLRTEYSLSHRRYPFCTLPEVLHDAVGDESVTFIEQ